MHTIEEINARLAEINTEIDGASGEALDALEREVQTLTEERTAIENECSRRQQIRTQVAAGNAGTQTPNPAAETSEERAANAFMQSRHISMGVDETRSAILTSGNLAMGTKVSAINDVAGVTVSSIVDLVDVENCDGMSSDRVPYVATETSAASAQTEGSAATEGEPTFDYVDITPTTVAVWSQISKQARRKKPVNYMQKVEQQALLALRKKCAALCADKLKASSLNQVVEAETASVTADQVTTVRGTITEKTLRKLVLAYGGDESIGSGVLFLNKTDLLAFGDIRGTNEKRAIYKITPDTQNPNMGTIEEGGLIVRYCIVSGLTACNGTEQAASSGADKPTMFYGDPKALKLDLFSNYEISVSNDFAFTSLMDTILGDVEVGADVVVKNGFAALTIKKAAA